MSELPANLAELSPEAKRALLAELLRRKASADARFPLAYGQQALWFLNLLAPESAAYHVAFSARIRSQLDEAAFARAVQGLVDRHEILRTTFQLDEGKPVQVVHRQMNVHLETVDASAWSDAEIYQQVDAAYRLPFDLEKGPILRAYLFTRTPTDHVLLLVCHHIAMDGWSMWVLLDELTKLYAAQPGDAPLPPLDAQYSDFVRWQIDLLAGVEGKQMEQYWVQRLAGELPTVDLPLDYTRPAMQTFNGASHEFVLDASLSNDLRALARTERTTLYNVLLAAYYALLHRYTGQEDLIIGSPMAGRSRPQFANLIGDFINTVALRTSLADAPSARELIQRVRDTALGAIEHQDYPFPLLVARLAQKLDPSRSPIYQILFDLQRAQRLDNLGDLFVQQESPRTVNVGGLLLEPYLMPQQEGQVDLALQMVELQERFAGAFKYNTDLFAAETIARMAGHYHELLVNLVANPDAPVATMPMLTAAEREQMLGAWNATETPLPAQETVHALFAAQAARTPDAIAVRYGDAEMRYRELDQRANQLAHHLRTLGVATGDLVGVLMNRSIDMVVALLGVLKAGAAYVPLDPNFPAERLAIMLADSDVRFVVTEDALRETAAFGESRSIYLDTDWEAISRASTEALPDPTEGENLAYVIFTSGSTGRPKGVEIPHRAVVNFLQSMRHTPGLAASDVLGAVTTLSFDIAVLELFLPLVVGAQVVVIPREVASNGTLLAEEIARTGVNILQATPMTWRLLLAADWRAPVGFRALCGGEALPQQLARDLLALNIDLWNLYGPTETTVWSTVQHITNADSPIRIGQPIDNTQLHILDKNLQQVPVGVAGTLYIGGAGLAHGYLHRPDLTAERFIRHPFSTDETARLYNTGDTARYHADGIVEVIGRTDHQVKIRGFRIELGEIEAAIERHAAVREAIVTAQDDGRGSQRLVAYLTPTGETPPQTGELRIHLRTILPDYMIPAAFIALNEMPRTPNGKINRGALPSPEQTRARKDDNFVAPATPTEQTVAQIWRDVLNLPRVGVYDNFFDLGGHSLNAMEAIGACERALGVRMNPALFRAQTLGQVAANYDEMLRDAPTLTTAAATADAVQPSATPEPAKEQPGLAGRFLGAVRRAVNTGNKEST